MSKIRFQHTYNNIISLENLLDAWKEFVRGKQSRKDVQEFERNLMTNLIALHRELVAKKYSHSAYQHFKIADPKPRDIHKATVRDRLLHHAICRVLYPFFNRVLIADSYSCRLDKGTHKALDRFREFGYKVSQNNTRTCWVLKCDIKKFFANIDQFILVEIIKKYIPEKDTFDLLKEIIGSFSSARRGVGLPLGNLTSQLLVNIYMNEFDQFVKHKLKMKYYIRYADDFVIFSPDKKYLEEVLNIVGEFLLERLKLELHPDKISIKIFSSGVDFLGWIHFPGYRVLRTATKKRMMRRLKMKAVPETLASYKGLLKHGNAEKLLSDICLEYLRVRDN